jgi:hypothetical protein
MALLLLATDANADIFTTVNNGDYGNANQWDLGYAPGPSDTAIINQPNPLAISFTVVNVGCNGSSTGKIIAQVTGALNPPPPPNAMAKATALPRATAPPHVSMTTSLRIPISSW